MSKKSKREAKALALTEQLSSNLTLSVGNQVINMDAPETVEKGGTFAFPSPGLMFALGGFPSDTGIPVTPFTAMQAAAVYACVKVLSEDVAKLPINVQDRLPKGGWQNNPDHPISQIIHRPNEWMTPFEFWAYLVVSHQIRGNGYACILRTKGGDPYRLLPLLPDRVMCLLTDKGELYYSATAPQLGDQARLFHPEDMIHIRNMSIDGGILGTSVISCSQNVLGLALATQKNAATLFRQGSMPRGMITMPEGAKLDKPTSTRIGDSFSTVYAGSDNAHRVMVLEGGMKFEPVSMTAEDAQLLESRKFAAEEIARLFRVPQHKIGLLDHATFSNIENQNQQYIDDALMGICRRIEESLELTLLSEKERGRIRIRFDFDQLLRGDFKTRMEAYQIGLLNGVFTANEVREKEGLAPFAGGDIHRFPLNTGPGATKPSDTSPEASVPSQPEKNIEYHSVPMPIMSE